MTWRDNLLTTTAGVKLLADDGTTPGGGYKRAVDVVFKVQGGTAGHLAVLTSDGSIADGGAVPSGVSLPVATTSTLGGVKPDGSTVTTDGSGVLTVSSEPGPPGLELDRKAVLAWHERNQKKLIESSAGSGPGRFGQVAARDPSTR